MTASPNFPPALAALAQWVCWRLEPDKRSGRDAKVPYDPNTNRRAAANNPATWGTLAQALACAQKYNFSGVGFMFTKEKRIVGIDIDGCLTDGKPNDIAADILSCLPPTYIEISPSGMGLHIFLLGVLPTVGNRNSKNGVEMYDSARYFTMTGKRFNHPNSSENIADDNGAIDYIHAKFIRIEKTINPLLHSVAISCRPDIMVSRRDDDGQSEITQENAMGWRERSDANAGIFEAALREILCRSASCAA